ncbi:hypothetical protein [uncultured Tolumonas sp.]|uniref:hypothetical protein n=1 Tax=uncultured Tolumonas sp. TaxID=263765 RepID=UPI002930B2E8|nr:hypothetical protein [uncultured Tolumonas sp.]
MFFKNADKLNIMNSFLQKANSVTLNNKDQQTRLNISATIIKFILNQPERWDEKCKFNIKHIGEQFINGISNFSTNEPDSIDIIYVFSYRFLCEYDFTIEENKELNFELSHIKQQIFDNLDNLNSDLRSQLIYASYIMPTSILKEMINNPSFTHMQEFKSTVEKAEKLKADWDNEISQKNESVNTIKDKLDKYETGFNFVGLYDGFSQLSNKKSSELKWLLFFLVFMGFMILSPLITELILSIYKSNNNNEFSLNTLYTIIPIISIEIILIYYFRIILAQYTSVKAQLVQIELRKTLCQFIQNYSEYSMKIKEKDSSVLDKFENLIFSSVLTDPEKIPSTFDGIEQIGSLIKNLRSS